MQEPPRKKRALNKTARYTSHAATSPQFPNKKQMDFMREEFAITEIRYCSVPDEDGALPDFPMVDMAAWCRPVQLVLRRSDNGAREANWAMFFDHMGFTEVKDLQRNSTRPLWKALAIQYGGVRGEELASNVFTLSAEPPEEEVLHPEAEPEPIEDVLPDWEPMPDQTQSCEAKEQPSEQEEIEPASPAPGMHGAAERRRIAAMKAAMAPAAQKRKKKKNRLSRSKGKRAQPESQPAPPPVAFVAAPPPYEELLRAFLSSENVYVPGKTKDHNIVGVIRSLITPEVYRHRDHAFFFSMVDKSGLGQLYPTPDASQSSAQESLSNLELHRRVLRLEWAGEELLRSLLLLDFSAAALDQQDADDVAAAFEFHGGLGGQGRDYWGGEGQWATPVAGANPAAASLAPTLCVMREARASAFERECPYLVVDECAWGLPIAIKLFLARRNHAKRAAGGRPGARVHPMDPFDLRSDIMSLNKWRFQALACERAPMIEYGLLRTAYCKRLGAIAGKHATVFPAGADCTPSFDCMKQQAMGGRQDLAKVRAEEEARDLTTALAELGLAKSPAAEQISRVHLAIAKAMASDSHQAGATSRLHRSQSLPSATYSPLSYL